MKELTVEELLLVAGGEDTNGGDPTPVEDPISHDPGEGPDDGMSHDPGETSPGDTVHM